jgi:hypothetical protein
VKSQLSWTAAAEQVLLDSQNPLTGGEIASLVLKAGLRLRGGSAPEYSVQAAISKDLKVNGQSSLFVVLKAPDGTSRYWLKSKIGRG